MVTNVLVDAGRRLVASWRGQLVVLALGTGLLGLTMFEAGGAGDVQLRLLVGTFEGILLLAASIRMALIAEHGYDGDLESVAFDVLRMLPRLVTNVGAIAVVPIVVGWLALQLASLVPVVGLVTIPIAFVVAVFCWNPALLAACAVVLGERRWLPYAALRAIRGRQVQLVLLAVAGAVIAAMIALPLVVVGFVLVSMGGMIGLLGTGLAAGAIIPYVGCGALATWRTLGATVDVPVAPTHGDADHDVDVDVAAAFQSAATPAPVTWLEGPAWDVAVEPGAVWGTWIRIEAASVLGVRVSWSGTAAPELAFASEAGVWTKPGELAASGDIVQVAIQAGSTYIQVTSRSTSSQAITVGLLVPPAVAA